MITIHFSPIEALPNTEIQPKGPVSESFLARGITTFHQAAYYVNRLPYGINKSSENVLILFEDGFGTCLAKHGIAARLADELGIAVGRCEGFYPLTDRIVTGVGAILAEYGLEFIPRTHCFLVWENIYVDLTEGNCTGKNGLIETYLEIFRMKPECTQSENMEFYHHYYAEVCAVNPVFARLGVEGMIEVLTKCQVLNSESCRAGKTLV
jgi:hypothetical protein